MISKCTQKNATSPNQNVTNQIIVRYFDDILTGTTSASDDFILTSAKWFTANYNEVVEVLKIVKEDYEKFLEKSEELRKDNMKNFSLEKTTEDLRNILDSLVINQVEKPTKTKLVLPELKKVEK